MPMVAMAALAMAGPTRAQSLTVANGTATNETVPIYGWQADHDQHNQIVYPARLLTGLDGVDVTGMIFHLSQASTTAWGIDVTIRVKEIEDTSLTALVSADDATTVWTGVVNGQGETEMFTFDAPYSYGGGNLLVDITTTTHSHYGHGFFYGIQSVGKSYYQYVSYGSTSTSAVNFLPKTTFVWGEYCSPARGLSVSNLGSSAASLVWEGDGDNYGYQWGTSADVANDVFTSGTMSDTTITLSDLTPSTDYVFRVWRICDNSISDTVSLSFTTMGEPISDFPYVTGFEEGEDRGWEFINDGNNKWCLGTAVANTGTNSLYISNDNGATNAYTISGIQFSYAYRPLEISEDGQYAVSFDWKAYGESNYDYLRAWIAPALAVGQLVAGRTPAGGTSANAYTTTTPTGWIDLGGKMNLNSSWQTALSTPNLTAGSYVMVFMWANDNGGGTQPPAAVDNIDIHILSCTQPTNLVAVPHSFNIDLKWSAGADESMWLVEMIDSTWSVVAYDTVYTVNDLNPETNYKFRVRSLCGDGDTSFATLSGIVRTLPACPSPILAVDTVTPTTITLKWTPRGVEEQWFIKIGDSVIGNITDSVYTIEDLEQYTQYSMKVFAVCSDEDISTASNTVTARTTVTCPAPFLAVDTVTPTTITLKWTPGGEESQWIVKIGDSVITDISDTVYTIEDLEQYTQYSMKVFAVCSEGDTSFASNTVSARTTVSCPWPTGFAAITSEEVPALKWNGPIGDFARDYYVVYGPVGFSPTAVGSERYVLVEDDTVYRFVDVPTGIYDCYVRANCGSDDLSRWTGPVGITVGSAIAIDSLDTLRTCGAIICDDGGLNGAYSDNRRDTIVIYPAEAGHGLLISGTSETEGSWDYLRIYEGVGTTGTLLWEDRISGMRDVSVIPPMEVAGPVTITFYSDGSTSPLEPGFQLLVSCYDLGGCVRPSNLAWTSQYPADSVVVSWHENGEAQNWDLAVGAPGFIVDDAQDIITVSDTAYRFTDLLSGRSYDVYVRANCGGSVSSWVGPLNVNPGVYQIGTVGTATISMCGGTITDDGGINGQYSNNVNYTLTVYPSSTDSMLTFNGTFKGENSSYSTSDHLYIYEGVGTEGAVLWHDATVGSLQTIALDTCTSGPITIKFVTNGSTVNDGFVLNINCVEAPRCSVVDNVEVDATPTAALVKWQFGFYGEVANATVEYKADNADTWETMTVADGSYAVITDLTPATNYTVRVKTNCVMGSSSYVTTRFTTGRYCVGTIGTGTDQTTGVPVTSNWGNTLCQSIYTAEELLSLGFPATGATIGDIAYTWTNNATYAKQFSIYMSNTDASDFAAADAANWVTTGNTLVYTGDHPVNTNGTVSYHLTTPFQWDGHSNLCITTTMNQPDGEPQTSSGFTGHSTATSPSAYRSMYKHQDSNPLEVSNLSSISPTNRSTYRPSISLIKLECESTCANPVVDVVEVTAHTATLVWAPGSTETACNLFYRKAGEAAWSAPVAVAGFNYTLDDLASGTPYEFKIETSCTDGTFSASAQAITLCAPVTLPYTENFNTWSTGSVPACWSNTGSYTPASYGVVSAGANMTGNNGKSLYMYSSSGNTRTIVALPEMDTNTISVNQAQLVFSMYYSGTYYSAPTVEVGVLNTPGDPTSFVAVDSVEHSGAQDQWETFEVSLAGYTGNGVNVALRTYYNDGYSYFYIDDITLEQIPSCLRPDSLKFVSAEPTSATLSWRERSGATSWIVEYGPRGFQPGTGISVNASSNPFVLTNLTPDYQGDFYVRSVCGTDNISDYSRAVCAFATPQIPATLPYNYDFEDAAEWNNWGLMSNNDTINWYRGTAVADSSNYSMYISANGGQTYRPYVNNAVVNAPVYRDIDFGNENNTITISFRARVGGTVEHNYDGMKVFLADPYQPVSPADANITSPWGYVNDLTQCFVTVRRDTTWQTYTADFDTLHGVHRVVFYWFNQNTVNDSAIAEPVAVDNIHIAYSSCPRPLNLQATTTTNSATLTWDGPEDASYQVLYVASGETTISEAFCNTNSIVLTGLPSPASYMAAVRKICGTDTSYLSDPVNFQTLCDAISVFPWVEGFENEATFDCWSQEGEGEWLLGSGDGSQSGSHGGQFNVYSPGTTYDGIVTRLISPVLNLGGEATLSYWHMQRDWSGDQNELRVYYRTSQEDIWHLLQEFTDEISTWTKDSIDLPNPSATYQIAFEITDNYGRGVAIDDIIVTGPAGPSCSMPEVASITATYNTVTVNYNGTAAEYELAIMPNAWTEPAAGASLASTTNNSYTFTGLTPATRYYVGIRSLCLDDDMVSDWATVNITTEELPCSPVTDLEVKGTTYSSVELGWTVTGNETAWQVKLTQGTTDSVYTVTTNPATISGLYPNTTYTAVVRPMCGDNHDFPGDWNETSVQFTTDQCQPVASVSIDSVKCHEVYLSWPSNGASSYEVEIGVTGTQVGSGTRVPVTGNSYTFSQLDENESYDVHVRTVCATGIVSDWANATFETPRCEGIDGVVSSTIALYPNPATSSVNVTGIEAGCTVSIIDMNGRTVAEYKAQGSEMRVNVSDMAKGAYYVRVVGDNTNAIRKLVVR